MMRFILPCSNAIEAFNQIYHLLFETGIFLGASQVHNYRGKTSTTLVAGKVLSMLDTL